MPVTVSGSSTADFEIPWVVPNPKDYASVTPADIKHFCLVARVVTGCGFTYHEGENIWVNTKENNRVAWRNIQIKDDNEANRVINPPEGEYSNLMVGNIYGHNTFNKFEIIAVPNASANDFFMYGKAKMTMAPNFAASWVNGGQMGSGITHVPASAEVEFHLNNSEIANIDFAPHVIYDNSIQFTFTNSPAGAGDFEVDVIQYNTSVFPHEVIGGMRYIIKEGVGCPTLAATDVTICPDRSCSTISISNAASDIICEWYDSFNNHLGSGQTLTVCPNPVSVVNYVATQFGCILTGTATVYDPSYYNGSGPCLQRLINDVTAIDLHKAQYHLFPNPTSGAVILTHPIFAENDAIAEVSDINGRVIMMIKLRGRATETPIPVESLLNGLYQVTIRASDRSVITLKLVKMD
jgi:hypothetical protein